MGKRVSSRGFHSARWALLCAVIAVAGALLGYLLGAWSACGSSCRFDVNLFEAFGTWAGGLGTTAALALTALQISRGRRDRLDEVAREGARWKAVARGVKLRATPTSEVPGSAGQERKYTGVTFEVTNPTGHVLTDLGARLADRVVTRNEQTSASRSWEFKVPLRDLGRAHVAVSEGTAVVSALRR